MSDHSPKGSDSVTGRTPDAYEAQYMSGGGTVLHREKNVAPASWQLLLGAMVAISLVSMVVMLIAGMGLAAPALFIPMALASFLLWMGFAVLRVTVSSEVFHVQFGLFGPRIPIQDILEVESIQYDWKEFGGWGIKKSFKDGTVIYNMWGDEGRAAKVVYRDGNGRTKRVAVGSPNADLVVTALQRARSMMRVPTTESLPPLAEPVHEEITVEKTGETSNDQTSR